MKRLGSGAGWTRWALCAACIAFLGGATGGALAQKKESGKKSAKGAKGAAAKAAAKGPKPKFVLKIDKGDTVRGTIQKPEAFYILPRTSLNFEGLLMKRSFVPKIVEAVRKAPF